MHLVQMVLKNLFRRPTRTLLTVVGLSVAVSAVVALVGIANGFERSFLALYSERGVDMVVQRKGSSQSLSNALPQELGDQIRKMSGVESVVGGSLDLISFPEVGLITIIFNGWEPECPHWNRLKYLSGERLLAGDANGVVIGKVLAADLGVKVGDTITMYGEDFVVRGVVESDSVYENKAAFELLDVFQRLTSTQGKVTGYTVATNLKGNATALEALRQQIEALAPDIDAQRTNEFIDKLLEIRIVRGVTWLTSAIALVIGTIGMLNTMVMSVYERAKEIGTLRALGWRRRKVVRMVLSESLFLSITGAILGTISAVLLTNFFSHFKQTSGLIEGDIAPAVILEGFVIAILVGLIGAAYPAWWGSNLSPMDALRRK